MFKIIYSLFVALPSFRWVLISATGLGLGLGMSLIVFQNPQTSFASPVTYEIQKLKPDVFVSSLKINNQSLDEKVDYFKTETPKAKIKVYETDQSEGLGISKLAILAVKDKNLVKNLERVLLGEKILLVGSNNGLYVFTAIETRIISKADLNQIISFYDDGIIIYGQKSWLNDEVVLVVGK